MNETRQQNVVQAPPKNRLRRERERRGWSRSYVAEKVGSDAQAIGRWERGKTSPSPFHRQGLCELFCLNADELGLLKEDTQEASEEETVEQEIPVLAAIQEERPAELVPMPIERPQPLAPVPPSPSALVVSYRGMMGIITFSVVIVMLCTFILSLFAWKVLPSFSLFPGFSNNSSVAHVEPGGLWVYPANGQTTVHGVIYFAAKAYPTNPGDPSVNHVNFTIGWKGGGWRVGCTAYPPTVQNLYTCPVIMAQLNVPAGNIQISFDVYDQVGNVNFAPNGVHTVLYAP
jgi:transcriptional regulator with XRE-family HTH domain